MLPSQGLDLRRQVLSPLPPISVGDGTAISSIPDQLRLASLTGWLPGALCVPFELLFHSPSSLLETSQLLLHTFPHLTL
jgi:hypothetical protein